MRESGGFRYNGGMNQVRLRPLESEDVPTVAAFLAHPSLVGRRGLDHDRPVARSVTALAGAIEQMVDPEDGDAWVVDANGVVGLAMVDWWWDALTPWAHVVIDPQHQRQGHGGAAARLVIDHLFLSTPAALVQYGIPSWDEAGLAFAESLRGEGVGSKRRAGIRDGAYFDLVEYRMPRTAWEVSRAARR